MMADADNEMVLLDPLIRNDGESDPQVAPAHPGPESVQMAPATKKSLVMVAVYNWDVPVCRVMVPGGAIVTVMEGAAPLPITDWPMQMGAKIMTIRRTMADNLFIGAQ